MTDQATHESPKNEAIIAKLDLAEHVASLKGFFARPKSVILEGDVRTHHRYIAALGTLEFPEPRPVPDLQNTLNRLRKQAVLSLDEIHAFARIIGYFKRLKTLTLPEPLSSWIHEIEVPGAVDEVIAYLTDEGDINPEREPRLADIDRALQHTKRAIKENLLALTRTSKLSEYLVDTQVHLYNGEEALLVRGGFNRAIKATVLGRSAGGFFYILPEQIAQQKARQDQLVTEREAVIWEYCQKFSAMLHEWERFLRFIDKEYDRFDHYQARVSFARAYEFEFVLPSQGHTMVLEEFAHPAIDDPVPVSIALERPIMLITGVNAGGKTMLLKSILSAAFMAKYLLPFRCNSSKTRIGSYSSIEAIIDDPQSVKNDISTFAGRMLEFARLFKHDGAIVGIDEIELGTDADEAAALFKVMLETLQKRDITFVVTTHHKRLASLMATNDDVELIAALYDEERRLPTYTFLQGSIGKSYAFETAQRYGIDPAVVAEARKFYGEDKERLGELIEKSTMLEREMRQKSLQLEEQQKQLEKKQANLVRREEQMQEEQRKALATLENRYNAATKRAQQAIKSKESTDAHRLLNEAHKHKQKAKQREEEEADATLQVGDRITYRTHKGELVGMKAKEATILVDGMKMRVPLGQVRKSTEAAPRPKPPQATAQVKRGHASVSLKLLGMRGDEAIDAVDAFLSNALLNGLSEVEIIHGTGTGVLVKLVSEHLKLHPKVKGFHRVRGNLGATIVEL